MNDQRNLHRVAAWSVVGGNTAVTLHLALAPHGAEPRTYELARSQAEAIAAGLQHCLRERRP